MSRWSAETPTMNKASRSPSDEHKSKVKTASAHEAANYNEEIGATSGKTHEEVLRDVVGPERARRATTTSSEDQDHG